MKRLVIVIAVACVVPALALSQDKKDVPKGKALPANWAKLGLSDDQKQRVHEIQSKWGLKIDELRKQLTELQKKQKEDLDEVLTAAQRARLKEIVLEKIEPKKPDKPEKPAAEKKPGGK